MIEELTPQLLMVTMVLVLVVVPILTALLSAILLWRYRIAVRRAMAATVGFEASPPEPPSADRSAISAQPSGSHGLIDVKALQRRLLRSPWRNAASYLVGGLALALVFAGAAHVVYPHRLGLAGSLIAVWIYLWPFFVAAPLIVPARRWRWVPWSLLYLAVFTALILWAGTVIDIPSYHFGAVVIPARSSITPESMLRLWLVVNAAPTLLVLLCFNRWVRAVAPLVLALATAAVSGLLAVYLTVFSSTGADTAVATAVALELHIHWILATIFIVALLVVVLFGWWLMVGIAAAYRRGSLSEQTLLLDALWLFFASTYAMWLVAGGVAWIATVPAAFVAYKLASWLATSVLVERTIAPRGLTFLRVFSLGRRSEVLFDAVTRHWRYLGSIQMITGPDLATSTLQPHQFLDFLSGRLRQHFVSDQASLERSLTARDGRADPDGRFRVNNFYCHADSWQAVLPHLVEAGDSVLMDLRSFSEDNAGCAHELRFLVGEVPYRCCLLLIDEDTDEAFLDATLERAAAELAESSPNYGRLVKELPRLSLDSDTPLMAPLLARLCETANSDRVGRIA